MDGVSYVARGSVHNAASIAATRRYTCRWVSELAYGRQVIEGLPRAPLVDEWLDRRRLHVYATTTREPSGRMGRITETLASGKVFSDLGIAPLDPGQDRLMICGSYAFNIDVKALLEGLGFAEGSNSGPGHFVIEKAFVGDGV